MLYDVVSQKDEKAILIVHNVNGLTKAKAEEKRKFLNKECDLGKVWIRESEV